MTRSNTKNELYRQRREAGLCVQCGENAAGKSKCSTCAAKDAECRQARNEKRKRRGVCTGCGESAKPGCTLCQLCIDKRSRVSLARYRDNKAAGVCRYCGDPSGGESRCQTCKGKLKTWQADFYRTRKAAGLCTFCGEPAVTETLCQGCRVEHNIRGQKRWTDLRQAVLDHYGRACAECGETEEELLQIDHVNGDGAQHRREIGESNLYNWLKQNGYPTGFQTLCAACNWRKRNKDRQTNRVSENSEE